MDQKLGDEIMPRRKTTGKRNPSLTLTNKIKELKKQIKILKEQTKKIKTAAFDEAYRKAMAEILREIEKRDQARTKIISAAQSKFEKSYDSVLAKKAKIKKRSSKKPKAMKKEKTLTASESSNTSSKKRGRPTRKTATENA